MLGILNARRETVVYDVSDSVVPLRDMILDPGRGVAAGSTGGAQAVTGDSGTAIVLIGDQGFLIPMVGTALSARAHTSDPAVPVIVYLTDADDDLLSRVRDVAGPRGVSVRAAPLAELARVRADTFPSSHHVPVAAMARLWLGDILDPEVTRFLYLDGDIDITSSLDPLLTLPLVEKSFLAGMDLPFVIEREIGKRATWIKGYLRGLGISHGRDYFNSGVLLADRSAWREIGRAAADFFLAHPERCQWHDQSALNAVAGTARGKLSPRWNYLSEFMRTIDPRPLGLEPAVWHFAGFPKPWQTSNTPWGQEFGSSLKAGLELLSPLGLSIAEPSVERVADADRINARVRWRGKWIYPWRRHRRARRILAAFNTDLS